MSSRGARAWSFASATVVVSLVTGAAAQPVAPPQHDPPSSPGPETKERQQPSDPHVDKPPSVRADVPFDAFTATPDDPRIPNFLRALRVGKDSLLLGGYIQPGFHYVSDTKFNNDDSDGFEFQNVRLIGRGEVNIYAKLGAAFRFDFDVNNGNFAVKDVYGTLQWAKDLIALDIGQFKVPFGLESIQPESKLQFFVPSTDRKITFDRDLGGQLRSDFDIQGVWFHLAAMMGNGEGGFRQRRNLDNRFLFAGRFEVDPLGRMELDEPELENRKKPQFALGLNIVHNGALGNDLGIADVGAAETRVGADARFWWRGISVRGEYLRGNRESTKSSGAFHRYAVSAQAGYVLPIPITLPKFEAVARFQQYDVNQSLDGTEGGDYVVDDTETRVLQFGANVYVFKHAVKFSFLYQLTDLLEGPKTDDQGGVLIGDSVFIGSQFAWL